MSSEESFFLDSGTSGCVYNPPIPCAKQKINSSIRSKLVGKIMKAPASTFELDVGTVVKGIVGWQRYFIVQEKAICDSKNFSVIRKQYQDDCKIMRNAQDKNLVQLISPYGGHPLFQMRINNSFNYMRAFRHMLEAVAKLQAQGVCHFDIKDNNILVDSAGTFRIIDFGSAFLGDQVTEETRWRQQFHFDPGYYPCPPDLAAQNAINDRLVYGKKIALNDAIHQIIKRNYVFKSMEDILGVSMESSEAELRKFWEEQDDWDGKNWVPFFRKYWKVWDTWGMGIIFLKLLQTCFLQESFIEGTWKQHGAIIRQVLKGLLRADPRQRLTGVEAEKLLREF